MLRADPVKWLLEADNPSVQFFTLRDILEKPETDIEVGKAKEAIMEIGVVPKILAKDTTVMRQ